MEGEKSFLEDSNEITTAPNHLYYEFEMYGKEEFLSFLSDKLGKDFNITESEELSSESKGRKVYDVNLVVENLTENKKLVLKGGSNNYGNDGGMPYGFKVIHSDFNQTEIDEMLSGFNNIYHEWTKQQQNND